MLKVDVNGIVVEVYHSYKNPLFIYLFIFHCYR